MSKSKHYSIQTEETYPKWVKRFILFHNKRYTIEMGAPEISAYLSHLPLPNMWPPLRKTKVLNAVIFIYKEALKQQLVDFSYLIRAKLLVRQRHTLPCAIFSILRLIFIVYAIFNFCLQFISSDASIFPA